MSSRNICIAVAALLVAAIAAAPATARPPDDPPDAARGEALRASPEPAGASLTEAPHSAPDPSSETEQRRQRGRRGGQEIERTIQVLDLKEGDVVAEIGAGDGRFALRFAEVVGPEGRVYVNELSSSSLDRIRERAEERGLDNIVFVEGDVDNANLPDNCCDAMMMRMVYHMMTDPVPMSRSFSRALKPGGRLVILEGDPEPGQDNARGVPDNRAGMGIDPQIVIDELYEVGFESERYIAQWPGADYALLFRRTDADVELSDDPSADEPRLGSGPDETRITINLFDELLLDDTVVIIDVRPAGAFERDHLPGAISVPLEDLDDYLEALAGHAKTIVAYCD